MRPLIVLMLLVGCAPLKHPWPKIGGDRVVFAIEAPANQEVLLVGDFTDWEARPIKMEWQEDLWIKILTFDTKARIEYQFLIDGKWTIDPRNPNRCDNGVGGVNSWLAMPEYRPPSPLPPAQAQGRIEEAEVAGHKVFVYLPAAAGSDRLPVQYFHDGEEYLNRAGTASVFDSLIEARRISPMIGVFVKPIDRGREYSCDPKYVQFFVTELLPWVDSHYATKTGRDDRGLMGASLGGLISVHLFYAHPELFGRVASQSGAFYSDDHPRRKGTKVFDRAQVSKIHPSRFWLSAGRYEWLLEENRSFDRRLTEWKVPHTYIEGFHGHTWTFWKETLPEALETLWRQP